MSDLAFGQRLLFSLLSYFFWFTHWTSTHRFLGLRYSTLLKTGVIVLLLIVWLRDWGNTAVALLAILTATLFLLYWIAQRAGYFRFVPGEDSSGAVAEAAPLPYFQRVPTCATGVFSLESWEKHVLFRPAHYWQAPRGGHGIMVAHQPQRYLYQFFDAQSLLSLQQGYILYGRHPSPALAITFRSIWGPELAREPFSFFGRAKEEPEPIERTIYLSFDDEQAEQQVWHNIVRDARQARLDAGA